MKGFLSTIKHFQLMGIGWMRDRESGSTEPKGGICADQMGLGKTVMVRKNHYRRFAFLLKF
jgi:SNF2 family DNA or RNA helicase